MAEKKYVCDYPNLLAEWNYQKNKNLDPSKIRHRSEKVVWWICHKGHEWESSIVQRTNRGSGCPFCSGHRTITGKNDLATVNPALAAEWHPTKNGNLNPSTVAKSSGKMVWWICENGHEWEATVINRNNKGSGCPYCSGRMAIPGVNDLATTNPSLAAEWHPTRNGTLKPSDISEGSGQKVWWQCVNGHEWPAVISSRSGGRGCPTCGNMQKKITFRNNRISQIGSLLDNNPEIAAEWHPTKNGELLPSQVLPNSNQKVWWKCKKGHEWKAVIQHRNKGVGCPHCANELQTSFPEQVLFYYFSKITNTENRYLLAPRTEIDVFLPDLNIAIEYDGIRFHGSEKARVKEAQKNKQLSEKGITLFRVKETGDKEKVADTENTIYCYYSANFAYLNDVVQKLLKRINIVTNSNYTIDVDVNRDRAIIYTQYIEMEKANSLLALHPDIAVEWHPTKNHDLQPSHVTPHSNKVVWWKCSNGHEWEAAVNHRSNGSGCPYCANKKVLSGYNDLQTKFPEIAAQWHPTRNEGKLPSEVLPFSNKKAWWLCPNGHEWPATISSRSSGNGCPHCKGVLGGQKRIANMIDQQGSLATRMPLLATEWHPTKNETLLPTEVTISSGKKVWWLCSVCGHEWRAVIGSRSKGAGCPKCGKKQQAITLNANLLAQTGSLLENNPVVAAEWHPTKNGNLSVSQVLPNSTIKVWWQCKKGHEWEAAVANRNQGTGCPQCKAAEGVQKRVEKLIQKQGSLATALSVLAAEWHPTQNGELNPSEVTISSGRKVWWKCSICGHEWAAVIGSRSKGAGCPQCAREKRKK